MIEERAYSLVRKYGSLTSYQLGVARIARFHAMVHARRFKELNRPESSQRWLDIARRQHRLVMLLMRELSDPPAIEQAWRYLHCGARLAFAFVMPLLALNAAMNGHAIAATAMALVYFLTIGRDTFIDLRRI